MAACQLQADTLSMHVIVRKTEIERAYGGLGFKARMQEEIVKPLSWLYKYTTQLYRANTHPEQGALSTNRTVAYELYHTYIRNQHTQVEIVSSESCQRHHAS